MSAAVGRFVGGLVVAWSALLCGVAVGQTVSEAVREAGNESDDAARLAMLKKLRSRGDLPAGLRADLDPLVSDIERWLDTRRLTAFRSEKDFRCKASAGSPLHPLLCFYQARALVWDMVESGAVRGYPERVRSRMAKVRKLLDVARRAFPRNPVIGMYLGEPIPWPKRLSVPDRAPRWAVLQREALERLADIIHWWAESRQHPDGSFGGGLEDDCEMWRWWAPVLIAFKDPKIEKAQERLSACILARRNMRKSFSSYLADVEHSAEWSADSLTPMMHLAPDDPRWRAHALNIASLMRKLWTGRNQRGFLQFKSTYVSSERVDEGPRRACDTVYHPRAVQPVLLYWQRTADPEVGRLVTAWMDTWCDAAKRAERGKPARIVPSAIHWPDGRVGGPGPNWWEPQNYPTRLYEWPSAMPMMLNTMVLTYHMTAREKYLEPLLSMARILREHLARPTPNPQPGTEAWCARRMGFLGGPLAKWRLLTGDERFDDLLRQRAPACLRFRLFGQSETLLNALEKTCRALRVNLEAYTSEVRWTDRVLAFPSHYLRETPRPQPSPDPRLLYSMATGDPGDAGYFPMNAVRWLTPPGDIAALVTESGRAGLEARLFHFGAESRTVTAEFYLLEPAGYSFELRVAAGEVLRKGELKVAGPGARLGFELPAQRECVLKLARAPQRMDR